MEKMQLVYVRYMRGLEIVMELVTWKIGIGVVMNRNNNIQWSQLFGGKDVSWKNAMLSATVLSNTLALL